MYQEIFDNKTDALKREAYIKKQKSRKFIEKLIAGSVHPDL
jgi:predicted GIY-YIG superfamily endonuclease